MWKGKKFLAALLACSMAVTGLCGCGKKAQNDAEPTQAGEDAPGQAGEPTQTTEAKKMKQFSDLAQGETYAKINIKDFGTITVKFFPEEAPLAVENFITHAKDGYYDGVTFHRVIDDFMIQGGDPTGTGRGGESIWGKDFADEFADGLHPVRGALCMANTGYANSNSSQFFLVQADAASIAEMKAALEAYYDGKISLKDYFEEAYSTKLTDEQVELYESYGGTPWLFGHHTVFGQMLDGFDVLDAVAGVKTAGENDTPIEDVVIESIEVLEYDPS